MFVTVILMERRHGRLYRAVHSSRFSVVSARFEDGKFYRLQFGTAVLGQTLVEQEIRFLVCEGVVSVRLLPPTVTRRFRFNLTTVRHDRQNGMSNLSLALSLGQSGSSQVFSADHSTADHNTETRPPLDESQSQGEEEESDSEKEEEAPPTPMSSALKTVTTERQHSTVEYLSGMIHSQCGQRLLPKFSSWAISVLGRYTSYSHAQGLDQPGFLHGSNFLIPWDITLRVDRERWPPITESKRNKGKKGHRDGGELSLKVFIGLEYECPRGHRFFMSAPDRMIRANSGGGVKDGPNKLLTSDMPLYSPCQCRANKGGYMAQLMRIFVAAPEGPMHVTLTPRVRPAPEPCPVFFPGNDKPINLPPGMVSVLRLPYVYLGDSEPYYMPDQHQQLLESRLFKGVFGYTENEGAAK